MKSWLLPTKPCEKFVVTQMVWTLPFAEPNPVEIGAMAYTTECIGSWFLMGR